MRTRLLAGVERLELLVVDDEAAEIVSILLADERRIVEEEVSTHGRRGEATGAIGEDVLSWEQEHGRPERPVERGVAVLSEVMREERVALLGVVVVVALLLTEDRAEDLDVGPRRRGPRRGCRR